MARGKCLLLFTASVLLCPILTTEALVDGWNQIFYQVAIRAQQPVADKIEDYHLCSGLIVDPYYVVTTAKCLEMR